MADDSGVLETNMAEGDSASAHPSDDDACISSNMKASEARSVAAVPVAPPPDGGLKAWIQVLGAHFLFFNSW
jgi:hypothetical protein